MGRARSQSPCAFAGPSPTVISRGLDVARRPVVHQRETGDLRLTVCGDADHGGDLELEVQGGRRRRSVNRLAWAVDRGRVGEVEGGRLVPMRRDLSSAQLRAGGDVTLVGIEVPHARRLRDRGKGSQARQSPPLAARRPALAGEPYDHRRRVEHGDLIAFDRPDQGRPVGGGKGSQAHWDQLVRTREGPAGAGPSSRLAGRRAATCAASRRGTCFARPSSPCPWPSSSPPGGG